MKRRAAHTLFFVASRLLLLLLSMCLLLSACAHPPIQFPPSVTDPTKELQTDDTQHPTPSENITPEPGPYISRMGNICSICLNDRYQDKNCQSVIISIGTLSYKSHDLCRIYLSQADNELIGVRVLGRDITPTTGEDGTLIYCLDMNALGVDFDSWEYAWNDLWIQLFFSTNSLKENQAYPMMVEKHYEEGLYEKEELHVFGERGVLEYSHTRVSSARVYASLSQLYEQTNVSDLHLPASATCMQVEYQNAGKKIIYDLAFHQGIIYITQEAEGSLEKELSYKDHFSETVIHEKGGITYYIVGHWDSCGAPAVPTGFIIYWQIGTRCYRWDTRSVSSFEEATALVEDLKTFPAQ